MHCCSNCGAKIEDNVKFCPECGSPNSSASASSPERKQEYAGKILKCPNCGEVLKSFEGICPACGHEITSAQMSTSLRAFIDGLQDCDNQIARSPIPPQKGFKTWSKRSKFWWIVLNLFTCCIPLAIYLVLPFLGIWGGSSFLPEEKRKASLIKNYAYPNDRANVLEILLFIKTQMAFIASEKIDRSSIHWANIWGKKSEQVYQKAELIIKGDSVAASVHSEIILNWKKIKKSFGIRICIALVFICGLIVFMAVSGGPFNLLSNSFKGISNPLVASVKTFEWPDTELSRLLPRPESDKGKIWDIDAEGLWIEVHDFSISQFESYMNDCKEKGFSVEGEREGNSYKAHNDSGYRLKLDFTQYNSQMAIHLDAPKVIGEFEWPSTEICNLLPVPESNKGEISHNDEEQLRITVYDLSEEQCNAYVEACKENGFVIDSITDSISYEAFNESGFHLELRYYEISERGLYIVCDAPMEMETIRWPDTKLVNQIPVPKTDLGKIDNESGSSFTVYIGNTTPEEYADYVDACVEKGFTEGLYTRDKAHFHGENSNGSTISVDYIGFSIMKIDVYNFDY